MCWCSCCGLRLQGRQSLPDHQQSKRIFAEVKIHASVEQVWRVITDYDHLADFVPNLVTSERLPTSIPGRIHLRQLGCSQSVFWRLEAEAVLECVEVHKAKGAKELRFQAIEGDFKASAVAGSVLSKHHVCLHDNVQLQSMLSAPEDPAHFASTSYVTLGHVRCNHSTPTMHCYTLAALHYTRCFSLVTCFEV